MKEADEIRVAIAGAGAMGKGIAYQCQFTPGVRCVGLADIDMGKAMEVATWLGYEPSVAGRTSDRGKNRLAITEEAKQLAVSAEVDVFIDATSSVSEAGQFCEIALLRIPNESVR